MAVYEERKDYRRALADAAQGKQALFLHVWYGDQKAPACFRGMNKIGKLFDQNKERLIATAKRFGVRVIKVDHDGDAYQHVDLIGRPLARAIEELTE